MNITLRTESPSIFLFPDSSRKDRSDSASRVYEHIFKRKNELKCSSTNIVFSGCCIGPRFLLRFTLIRHLLQGSKLARISNFIVFTFAVVSSADRLPVSVTLLYLPSLLLVQQIVKQIIPNFKEPITRAHIVNLQFYIWAICKTLHQTEDRQYFWALHCTKTIGIK